MKAIETVYKGYRFRSRLEARWAVFFDALKLQWLYEPETMKFIAPGFTNFETWYLPDFLIAVKGTRRWIEIKRDYRDLRIDDADKPGLIKFCNFGLYVAAQNAAGISSDIALLLSGDPCLGGYDPVRSDGDDAKKPALVHSRFFWTDCPFCLIIDLRKLTRRRGEGAWIECPHCNRTVREDSDQFFVNSPPLRNAYEKAMSATFK